MATTSGPREVCISWKGFAWISAVIVLVSALVCGALVLGPRRHSPHELDSVQDNLQVSKSRRDELRAQLIQESLTALMGAVGARDAGAIESGRKGLIELGTPVVPSCRELAIKTASDPLKRELIAVIGAFKEPEAAAALVDIYQSQSSGHREVKETAARTLAKMGTRAAAAGLERLVRQEKDPWILIEGNFVIPAPFRQFMSKYEVTFAIVASLDKGIVENIGDPEKLPPNDLVSPYFGDAAAARNLNSSLEGRLLPQTVSQGYVRCVICKPNEHTLVGLFFRDERDVFERAKWGDMLNQRVLELFAAG